LGSQLATPAGATDLISFLKALPDCRMCRGIRFPQWWMLLVAIFAILSNQGSLVGMERFAKRHRQTVNELLGTDFGKSPSDVSRQAPCQVATNKMAALAGLICP
jgi:hypothetical protein